MNKRILLIFLCLLSVSFSSFSQVRLQITNLSGFPFNPPDTAYSGIPYNGISMYLKNVGNQQFQGIIDVILRANPAHPDTIYNDSTTFFLNPGDSVNLPIPTYQFTSLVYDGGDNIVVVWPAARTPGVPSDSLTGHVFFVDLLGIGDIPQPPLVLFPNPASRFVHLDIPDKNAVQYVRIYDVKGSLIKEQNLPVSSISFDQFQSGLYFIKLMLRDGTSRIGKVLKY